MRIRTIFSAVLIAVLVAGLPAAHAAEGKMLKIGITLHPYYSFVANIVGDRAEVIPLIDSESNPHGYSPRPDDMRRASEMDVIVVNGIGHDEWAFEIIQAAGRKDNLPLIYANDSVALLPVAGDQELVVNAHTFVSVTAAVQQVYEIARRLGELDPANSLYFRENAQAYGTKLRRMRANYMMRFAELDTENFQCATMHGAYDYLMQEFGLTVSAVIEPRHGVNPTARQLAQTIDQIKAANVNVLFAEAFFGGRIADTIQEATGVQVYSFSHIDSGTYTRELFEQEMQKNLDTLAEAIESTVQAN
jgi:zinc transport system substrate-binding protein